MEITQQNMEKTKIEPFVCLKCGNCCKNFLGLKKEKRSQKVPDFFGGEKSRVLVLAQPTLALWDWEIQSFPPEHIMPNYVVFDLKSERTIVISYTLSTNSCPLIKEDNLCPIYEKRPIACRSFPNIFSNALIDLEPDEVLTPQTAFSFCSAEVPMKELWKILGFETEGKERIQVNEQAMRTRLFERYGDSYIYQILHEGISKEIGEILNDLTKRGEIRLATKGYKIEHLIKRIERSPKISFSELLKERGMQSLKSLSSPEAVEFIRMSLKELSNADNNR